MSASNVMTRPAHIPEAATVDFDIFNDPELKTDPHGRIARLMRDAAPVFWTPRNGGHWMAAGYDAAFQVARDYEKFTNVYTGLDGAAAPTKLNGRHIPRSLPTTLDPPEHGIWRAPLAEPFGPKAIRARAEEIRSLAVALIDAIVDKGHCDFIATVAEPLPVQVFMKMMGLPLERLEEFRKLVQLVLGPSLLIAGETNRLMCMVADTLDEIIIAREHDPKDDLISALWAADFGGQKGTLEIVEDFSVNLFVAGLDTVINGIGYGIRHLAANPELQRQLRADPSLIPVAAEEILRCYTFTTPPRWVAKDLEFYGWQMKAGERIVIYLPAADLDAKEFDAPEKFDLNRRVPHLAFGAGAHRCIGSHLARLELHTLYEEVLKRLPEFRLDPEKPASFRPSFVLSFNSLEIRWD